MRLGLREALWMVDQGAEPTSTKHKTKDKLAHRKAGPRSNPGSLLSCLRDWPDRSRQWRLALVVDSIYNCAVICAFLVIVRVPPLFLSWLNEVLPQAENQPRLESLVPIDPLRWLVTVVDCVSILLMVIMGACYVCKFIREELRRA